METVVIIPSSGGRFVLKSGGKTPFDKSETGRFPPGGGSKGAGQAAIICASGRV